MSHYMYFAKFKGASKDGTGLVRIEEASFMPYRRKNKREYEREADFDHDVEFAARSNSATEFLSQEGYNNAASVRSDVPGFNRHDVENRESRLTTIRANLWDARISKVGPSGQRS